MAKAIKLLDFNKETMIKETIFINQYIPNTFNYGDLKSMRFDEYEQILNIARELKNAK